MKEDFIIPLNGLKPGRTEFSWHCGDEFFESFGNQDILDADIRVRVEVRKSGNTIDIDCFLDGTVTVLCDRCMDELMLPVVSDPKFRIMFGAEPKEDREIDGRELLYVPEDERVLDLKQEIYDYSCLSLPMQKVHEEGKCNPLSIRYLSGDDAAFNKTVEENRENDMQNPFAVLKGLINNEERHEK